jgi:hypothetical protein
MGQVLTLCWLRYRIWVNGLRLVAGVANTAAAVLKSVVAAIGALALGVLFAVTSYLLVMAPDDSEGLGFGMMAAFYTMTFFAILVPLLLGAARAGLDLSRLAVFPISRARLYRISLAATLVSGTHLFWYPMLLGVTVSVVLLPAVNRMLGLALVGSILVVLVTWSHLLLLLLGMVLRRRVTREAVILVAFLVFLVASVSPAMVEKTGGEEALDELLKLKWLPAPVQSVISVLPPSQVAAALVSLHAGDTAGAAGKLAWLLLWALIGAVLGYRVFAHSLLDPGSSGSGRKAATTSERHTDRIDLAALLPPDIAAVAGKELRYLMRSTAGKLALITMPILVVIVALVMAPGLERSVLGLDPGQVAFLGLILYATILPHNFLTNAFAWESGGIKSYFLYPVSCHRVLLGKNIGVWLLCLVLLVECLVTWSVAAGVPEISTALTGALVFCAGLLSLTMTGNFISTLFPVKRDPAAITNSPSQVAVLLIFVALAINGAVIGTVLLLANLLGGGPLQPLLLAALVTAEAALYWLLLKPAGRLLDARKESLIEVLQAAESS